MYSLNLCSCQIGAAESESGFGIVETVSEFCTAESESNFRDFLVNGPTPTPLNFIDLRKLIHTEFKNLLHFYIVLELINFS